MRQHDILEKHVQSIYKEDNRSTHVQSIGAGPSEPASPQETGQPSQPSLALDSDERALLRLISGALPRDEQASIIESIFSSQKATDMVDDLQEKDAQTFIDIIHEVRYHSSISNGVS